MTAVSVFERGHSQLLLHNFCEVVGICVAATGGDGGVAKVCGRKKVHSLKEAPFADHLRQRHTCEELYGVTEVKGVDVEMGGDVLGFEEGGFAQGGDDGVEDRVAGGLGSGAGEELGDGEDLPQPSLIGREYFKYVILRHLFTNLYYPLPMREGWGRSLGWVKDISVLYRRRRIHTRARLCGV